MLMKLMMRMVIMTMATKEDSNAVRKLALLKGA